jgi:hypothetical protein
MGRQFCLIVLYILFDGAVFAQSGPLFGPDRQVTINGLTFDAMEPAISADGNVLFFNSLNDGLTTSLYYATRVNDTTFSFAGPLAGANQTVTPRLDAVPSSDSASRIYWTSLRDFPNQMDNCFYGQFNGSDVLNARRLHGTFYNYSPGWIMMDAAIHHSGHLLYYTNADFGPGYTACSGVPCRARLGVAQKINDSTFNKLTDSDSILQLVNDTPYVVYAPHLSRDGLELYYSRLVRSNLAQGTQICVSVRSSVTAPFGAALVLHPFSALVPEAPTLTTDMSRLYFHRKSGSLFRIFMRYRLSPTGLNEKNEGADARIYPNPVSNYLNITGWTAGQPCVVTICSMFGKVIDVVEAASGLDLSGLPPGVYSLAILQGKRVSIRKIVKN